MNRLLIFRLLRLVLAVGLVLAGTRNTASAVDTQTVKSGASVTLSTSATAIKDTSAKLRGKVTIGPTPGNAKTFSLVNTPPNTPMVITEAITNTDTTDHAIAVTVIPADNVMYSEAFKSLFVLFVVALLLESALSLLFNWRPFLLNFDGRGVKTVISLIVAWLFIRHFELDIVTRLVNVYAQPSTPFALDGASPFDTALIVAGGSAAANNVLVGLGVRSVKTPEQAGIKPVKIRGWVSVTVTRDKSVGPVDVLIGDPTKRPPVAGTITGTKPLARFWRLFLRDSWRYPMSGGFEVEAGSSGG